MSNIICKFATNQRELQGAFDVRRVVFIVEQGIPEKLEFDTKDKKARHIVALDGDVVIGTARVRLLTTNQAKLERIAVLKPYRNKNIGKQLVGYMLGELKQSKIERIVLHSQCTAIPFYKTCGFKEVGMEFWEDGIKHKRMELYKELYKERA